MTYQMKIALFDFDGTLVDNSHEMSFKEGESFDWKTFMERSRECCTFESTAKEMKRLQEDGTVCIICTARPESLGEYTMADLIGRKLGEDIVVMRSEELHNDELRDLDGVTDEGMIKQIIHKHHALYRQHVIDDMESNFGKGCIKVAYDDQERNLDTFLENNIDCMLVDSKGKIDNYPF